MDDKGNPYQFCFSGSESMYNMSGVDIGGLGV